MKKPTRWILLLAALGVAFGAGVWKGGRAVGKGGAVRKALYWVDPMNPSFRSPEPGTAPCGMPLEPVYEEGAVPGASPGEASLSAGRVRVSPERLQLIGVRVAAVERMPATRSVRLLGRVAPDETRVYRVTGATDGLARTVAPFTTGSRVRKGELLATLYLPADVVPVVQNYFARLDGASRVPTGREPMEQVRLGQWNVATLRNNLRSQGLMEQQLDEITRTRMIPDKIEVRAPVSGIVLARDLAPEQRFDKGDELFRIADLGRIWVLADVFGGEAQAVKPGAAVTVTLPDQGGAFSGRVSQVKPQFDPATRTLKVRIEVDNPDDVLRPDMFVDVELPVELGPGLFVPKDAVLDSGLQRVVFVQEGAGLFAPRKVRTGRRFGDQVEILGGLMEGETVVTSGTFLLDSESRMRAAGAAAAGAALDPICGMEVEETKARSQGLVSERGGTTWFFCTETCKRAFDRDPKSAAARAPGVTKPMAEERHTAMAPSKKDSRMADPVCGMEVDPDEAVRLGLVSTYQGVPTYFCSPECKQTFDMDPRAVLTRKPPERAMPSAEHGGAMHEDGGRGGMAPEMPQESPPPAPDGGHGGMSPAMPQEMPPPAPEAGHEGHMPPGR